MLQLCHERLQRRLVKSSLASGDCCQPWMEGAQAIARRIGWHTDSLGVNNSGQPGAPCFAPLGHVAGSQRFGNRIWRRHFLAFLCCTERIGVGSEEEHTSDFVFE